MWKIPYVGEEIKVGKELRVERNSIITPNDVKKGVWIHNGKEWKRKEIKEGMVGLKMGSLVLTKKRALYKRKKKGMSGKR